MALPQDTEQIDAIFKILGKKGSWERTPAWMDWMPPWRRKRSLVELTQGGDYDPLHYEHVYASHADFLTM